MFYQNSVRAKQC